MKFSIFTQENSYEWNRILRKVEMYDFYHTLSYHLLDRSGEARMLVFEEGDNCCALPLIFRKIPHTNWQDVTSVYGYAGWIRTPFLFREDVFEIIEDYFIRERVVSAFSRLHPLVPGSDFFTKGSTVTISTTFAIDLALSFDQQFKSYSESVQREIKKNKGKFVILPVVDESGINDFIKLYYNAMDRLNAASQYYFAPSYFYSLLQSDEYESFIFLLKDGCEVAGGALFTVCNNIMQYHLGAVNEQYTRYSPLKLLIDEARIYGNKHHLSILHLGGGYGNKEDGLSVFKSRISTTKYPFKVWKWVVDEASYLELSGDRVNTPFFPAYRC